MKKAVFSLLLLAVGVGSFAQKLDKIKDLEKNKKYEDAKTQIDQYLTVEKNAKDQDAWYTKAKIYNDLATDSSISSKYPTARADAFDALKKYVSMDEKKQYLQLQLENYKPIMDIYQGYFKSGAAAYNKGDYKDAYPNFQKCLEAGAYMFENKWSTVSLDTNVVLYAGISAEKANMKDDAATYYAKLADAKVHGEGMDQIYKWLVVYYADKKDEANMTKYIGLGKQVYPADGFWESYELDYLREKGDKAALFAKYKEMIAKYPDSATYRFNYAVELYQEAYKADASQRPANSDELIKEAQENFKKVLEIKPNYAQPNLVLGQISYNQGVDLNAKAKAIKPGAAGKLTPDQIKQKAAIRDDMNKKFDEAIPYFEKVDQILGGQGKLKMDDKSALKDALDLLVTIYDQKNDKEKMKAYEDKFNNVDKQH